MKVYNELSQCILRLSTITCTLHIDNHYYDKKKKVLTHTHTHPPTNNQKVRKLTKCFGLWWRLWQCTEPLTDNISGKKKLNLFIGNIYSRHFFCNTTTETYI